jgi:hypothetical protein
MYSLLENLSLAESVLETLYKTQLPSGEILGLEIVDSL